MTLEYRHAGFWNMNSADKGDVLRKDSRDYPEQGIKSGQMLEKGRKTEVVD